MPYTYVLTSKELSESKNQMVQSLHEGKNSEFSWVRDSRVIGWRSFINDVNRMVMINSEVLDSASKEELNRIKSNDPSDPEKIPDALSATVKSLFHFSNTNQEGAQQVAALLNHYSQAPGLFLVSSLGHVLKKNAELIPKLIIGDPEVTGQELKDRDKIQDLYRVKNKIYLKIIAKRFPVVDVNNNKKVAYLEGPVEGLFELDGIKGFVLKKIETNSEILKDLYLGEFANALQLFEKLKAVESKLGLMLRDSKNPLEVKMTMLKTVLDSLEEYREKKLSLQELLTLLQERATMIKGNSGFFDRKKAFSIHDDIMQLREILQQLAPTASPSEQKEEEKEQDFPFDMQAATAMIDLVSKTLFQISTKRLETNSLSLFQARDCFNATAIQGAASQVLEELKKEQPTDRLLLNHYLNLLTLVTELPKKNSELWVNLMSKGALKIISQTVSLLLYQEIVPAKVKQIQISLSKSVERIKTRLGGCAAPRLLGQSLQQKSNPVTPYPRSIGNFSKR